MKSIAGPFVRLVIRRTLLILLGCSVTSVAAGAQTASAQAYLDSNETTASAPTASGTPAPGNGEVLEELKQMKARIQELELQLKGQSDTNALSSAAKSLKTEQPMASTPNITVIMYMALTWLLSP